MGNDDIHIRFDTEGHFVRLVCESVIAAPPRIVFAFFERPEAFDLLVPPDAGIDTLEAPDSLRIGARTTIRVQVGPLRVRWVAEITALEPGRSFVDEQREGPFRAWIHRHEVIECPQGATLRDEIRYLPRFGVFGRIFEPHLVRPRLSRMLTHRHEVTRSAVVQMWRQTPIHMRAVSDGNLRPWGG